MTLLSLLVGTDSSNWIAHAILNCETNFKEILSNDPVKARYQMILWNEVVWKETLRQKAGKMGLTIKLYEALVDSESEEDSIVWTKVPEDLREITVSLISRVSVGFIENE